MVFCGWLLFSLFFIITRNSIPSAIQMYQVKKNYQDKLMDFIKDDADT